jgi:hypothetical protein
MVTLIRTVRVTGDWGKMESVSRALLQYWAKMPQVRKAEAWSNVTGPQDQFRFVAQFDSLADEEQFALKLWSDNAYEKVMTDFVSVFDIGTDELVRTIE